jgi:drug/metabolite transporter (DMT)-like permease
MAVGQVELIFVYIASRFVFKERMVLWEVLGVLIAALGILVVMLSG